MGEWGVLCYTSLFGNIGTAGVLLDTRGTGGGVLCSYHSVRKFKDHLCININTETVLIFMDKSGTSVLSHSSGASRFVRPRLKWSRLRWSRVTGYLFIRSVPSGTVTTRHGTVCSADASRVMVLG